MTAEEYAAEMVEADKAAVQLGFDYQESKLTPEQLAEVAPNLRANYERGIITGGELDCIVQYGAIPLRVLRKMR